MISVSDGQLSSSAAAIFTAPTTQQQSAVQAAASCLNTSATLTETVTLTLVLAAGGTARRVARAVLAPNEQLFVQGIPMLPGDILKGVSTDATTTDYVVSTTTQDVPFGFWVFDTNGSSKSVAATPLALPPLVIGTTLTVTAAHNLRPLLFGTVGGSTVTLPAATGTGNTFLFLTTATSTATAYKILAASSADFLNGIAWGFTGSTAKVFASAAATNHSLQMPFAGSQPSGGFIGDTITIVDVATALFNVSMFYQAGTTPTTPFSAATS